MAKKKQSPEVVKETVEEPVEKPVLKPVPLNAIHFSDGEKIICGEKYGKGTSESQMVNCPNCIDVLIKRAEEAGDPLEMVKVKQLELNDDVDFGFNFEGENYRLINNAEVLLPKSVIEHLRLLGYPYKTYVPGRESGQAMVSAGKRMRYAITPV